MISTQQRDVAPTAPSDLDVQLDRTANLNILSYEDLNNTDYQDSSNGKGKSRPMTTTFASRRLT